MLVLEETGREVSNLGESIGSEYVKKKLARLDEIILRSRQITASVCIGWLTFSIISIMVVYHKGIENGDLLANRLGYAASFA